MKTFLIAASLAAGLSVNAFAADSSSYSTQEKARYEVGNQKGQDGSQAGTMKQDQVQTRTRTSLQEGEGEQLKTQVREQKRLQERSQTDQMHQMNQMQQMEQMEQMHRTKVTDTQGRH